MNFFNIRTLLCVLFNFYIAFSVSACQVPVFRYALERWRPSPYSLVVFSRGELSRKHKAVVNLINKNIDDEAFYSNILLTVVDLDKEKDKKTVDIYKKYKKSRLPLAVLFYPSMNDDFIEVWSGSLTKENIRKIVSSPLRKQIAENLIKGDASVWIFVASGNSEKDAEAEKCLKKSIRKGIEEMELPEGVIEKNKDTDDFSNINQLQSDVPLKIGFSVLKLSRDDPKEQILLEILLNTEKGVAEMKNVPIAFSVFGRGRVLLGLIGKGISEENILDICGYLSGPCSCQVKAQNPGVDLLMSVNWDASIENGYMEEKQLPLLTGAGELIEGKAEETKTPESPGSEVIDSTEAGKESFGSTGMMIIAVAGLFLVLISGTIILKRNKK